MIEIVLLESLSERQVEEVRGLMHELNAGIEVSGEMVRAAVEAPGTRFFAAGEDGERIVGGASLCVGRLIASLPVIGLFGHADILGAECRIFPGFFLREIVVKGAERHPA